MARRQASSIAEGEGGQSNVNMVKNRDSKKPQVDLVSTNVTHAVRWDIVLVTKYVQLGINLVLNAVIKDTAWAACTSSEIESKKGGREGGREGGRVRDERARGDKQRRSRVVKHDPKSVDSIVDRFPKVFSGVGELSGYRLKLLIDPKVRPAAQKPRRIPHLFKEKITRKINELLDLNIIEKVLGPTTWVSLVVFTRRLKNMTETLLQERDITLNKDKCKIGMSQIVFMGLILNKYSVEPTEEKVKAISETKSPTNVECRTH